MTWQAPWNPTSDGVWMVMAFRGADLGREDMRTTTARPANEAMVTSLPFEWAKPEELAAATRSHWEVEVLHWIRDRVMDEDLTP